MIRADLIGIIIGTYSTERRCLMLFIIDAQFLFSDDALTTKWALEGSCPRSSNLLKPEFT